jgi:hypothetical protein
MKKRPHEAGAEGGDTQRVVAYSQGNYATKPRRFVNRCVNATAGS